MKYDDDDDDDDTFTARYPDGRTVRLRVKRDIEKLNDLDPGEGMRAMLKMFPNPEREVRSNRETFAEIFRVGKADDRDDDDGNDDTEKRVDHHASTVADLLVEAGTFPHRAAALHHVLHSATGQALLARIRKAADQPAKDPPMDTVYSIMKDAGIAGTCAAIVSKGHTTITESELVEAASKVAAERYPGLTEAQAFDRIYSDRGEEGQALRKAVAIAKAMPFMPTMVGGPEAMHEAVDAVESSEAYQQLVSMAEKMRAASPELKLSAAQAFDKVFTDPKNAALAASAHRRPAATTYYEFPR